MIRIIGTRGSGKTTKLLNLAQREGFVLVEPTFQMADYVSDMAKKNGFDVKVINAHEFMWYKPGHRDDKYVVDELDLFLQMIGIEGYSNGPRE
jgi:cytidylate kinase